jgi:hypothetical protein
MSKAMARNLDLDWKWTDTEVRPTRRDHPELRCRRSLPSRGMAFLSGVSSAIDFFGASRMWGRYHHYRVKDLGSNSANALAIYGDWCAIGADLHHGVQAVERTELDRIEH